MKDAFRWAAQGCPDGAGAAQCEKIQFPNFKELVSRLDGLGGSSDNADAPDPFDVDVEETSGDILAHPDHWDEEDSH